MSLLREIKAILFPKRKKFKGKNHKLRIRMIAEKNALHSPIELDVVINLSSQNHKTIYSFEDLERRLEKVFSDAFPYVHRVEEIEKTNEFHEMKIQGKTKGGDDVHVTMTFCLTGHHFLN